MNQETNKEWQKVLMVTLLAGMAWGPQLVHAETKGETSAIVTKASTVSFTDQSTMSSQALQAVQEAVKQGLITGYPDGSFRPDQPLTRKEMAALLANALKLDATEQAVTFKDTQGSWAASYIEAVRAAGLMTGDESGAFRPNAAVSREELAAILVRAIGGTHVQGGDVQDISDGDQVSSWAKNNVEAALKLGLMDTPDNRFDSKVQVKRQDIAAFLVNVFQSGERTGILSRIDGDIAYMDGKPYLIGQQLKQLFGADNVPALQGATLTYQASNRNVADLSALQIVQSGTAQHPVTLYSKGSEFKGKLAIAADFVRIQGDTLPQVTLMQGAKNVEIHADVNEMIVDTHEPIQIQGSGVWQQLKLNFADTQVRLANGIQTVQTRLAERGTETQIIRDTTLDASSDTSSTSTKKSSSGGGGGSSTTNPTPTPIPTPVSAIVPSDQYAIMGSGDTLVDLKNVFYDADQDELSYHAVTSDVYVAEAEVANQQLTLKPKSVGSTQVFVTAEDGKGGKASVFFNYTVTSSTYEEDINHSPVASNSLNDIPLLLNEGGKQISLSDLFNDEDGDALTYTVESASPEVATGEVTGDQLMLTPLQAGTSLMTITAHDGKGGTASLQFAAMVNAPLPDPQSENHIPVALPHLPIVVTNVLQNKLMLHPGSLFMDQDGDTLTYTITSSNPLVGSVVENGEDPFVSLHNAGITMIEISANDGRGGVSFTSFMLQVEAPQPVNHRPVVTRVPEPQYLDPGDGQQILQLNDMFSDEDGDTLTYTVVSSDPLVAGGQVEGNTLFIQPLRNGVTFLTMTANDNRGETTSFTIPVIVEKRDLFISEVVWQGEPDYLDQAIELYNPTNRPLEKNKIWIERSDQPDPIIINANDGDVIMPGQTFVIANDLSSFGSEDWYYTFLQLQHNNSEPVTLKLYYNNVLIDMAVIGQGQALGRNSGTVIGNTDPYQAGEWNVEGTNSPVNLGDFIGRERMTP
ncbi:S-layer homology domain-containing protein [Paenibacillus polymyxa]|uniref:S-layer homology domain-containing protein n=1 Tax=Paenibacillus polymyxa TaxID=1406 RepID=UPI002AB4772E|nr:S-layer homology domain-containing protein [Paenibacillus polymyxa]MDY8095083.1 S-layer homology domain-containing protein [Paenibacillus polymyxa]